MVSTIAGSCGADVPEAGADISLQRYCLESLASGQESLPNSALAKMATEHAMRGALVSGERIDNLVHLLRKMCRFNRCGANVVQLFVNPPDDCEKSTSSGKYLLARISQALYGVVQMTDLLSDSGGGPPGGPGGAKLARRANNAGAHFQEANVVAKRSPHARTLHVILNTRASQPVSGAGVPPDSTSAAGADVLLEVLLGRDLVSELADIAPGRIHVRKSGRAGLGHFFVSHTLFG